MPETTPRELAGLLVASFRLDVTRDVPIPLEV
jgi:hypothetical protein